MKNIHIIPTDKPSRFTFRKDCKYYRFRKDEFVNNNTYQNQHIYITSDEEIKEGDWIYRRKNGYETIQKITLPLNLTSVNKKIILTTDQDLIKDGIQPIDNEFLEWFVKNPSCEEVEVKKVEHLTNRLYRLIYKKVKHCNNCNNDVCCCILVVEPKQESLEEAAKQYGITIGNKNGTAEFDFIRGAKWMQERMYSVIREAFREGHKCARQGSYNDINEQEDYDKWFEQYRKK